MNLKQKAVSGVVWTSLQRFSQIFVQFVSGIILARLLSPSDYGCIGMLTIFMVLASSFIDGGFGSALIQKKRPTNEDYCTVFYWNLAVSFILYVTLYFSAPFISAFYKIDLLCDVLRIQSIVLILNALMAVQINQLNKQFKFKKIAIVLTITSFISLSVSIVLAYLGYGVWALVASNLVSAAIPCFIYWITSSWRPIILFSLKSFKELFGFGSYMLMSSLVTNLANNIQGLLIGKFYNPSMMGYYSKAHSTEILASSTISQVIGQVTYPLYSELQDDREKLIYVIRSICMLLAFFTFPLMFLLILEAKPLFILLYSDKWLDSVPYFQVLCFAGMAFCLQSANSQSISAIGKSKVSFKWNNIKQFSGIAIVIIGLCLGGMKGLLIGLVTRSWLTYFVNAYMVSQHVGYKIKKQLLDLLPIMLLSLISFGGSFIASSVVSMPLYGTALLRLIVFCFIYIISAYALKLEAFTNAIQITSPILAKFSKR